MKRIYLYAGKGKYKHQTDIYTEVSDCDYDFLNQWHWNLMRIYHTDQKIYYARRYEGKTLLGTYKAVLMHREILSLKDTRDKGDHKDGNGLNNTRDNLRITTHSENLLNHHTDKKINKLNNSKYFGVCWDKRVNKWYVSIRFNGVLHPRKSFSCEDIAALYYNEQAIKIKGSFARLNTVNPVSLWN